MFWNHRHTCRPEVLDVARRALPPGAFEIAVVAALALLPRTSSATVIQVPSQRPTVQAGIDIATNGDTVRVAAGTYTGAGNRDIRFGGRSIVVRSAAGAATCTIDAQDFGRGFAFDGGESSNARLEGFTITHGIHTSAGGGVYIANSSPTLSRCIIAGNRTSDGVPGTAFVPGGNSGAGGGIHVVNGSPAIVDCIISDNRTGVGGAGFLSSSGLGGSDGGHGGPGAGIYVGSNSSVSLLRCQILDNVTGAGGQGGSSVVCIPPIACLTYGEDGGNGGHGGGIWVTSSASAINCVFSGNRTGGGGAVGFGLELPLPFPGRGGDGAAWNAAGAGSSLVNCTLEGNMAAGVGTSGQPAGSGGGIAGLATVVNSILWGNNSSQIPVLANITFSDIQGGHLGVGNLAANPQFVDAAGGNLRLQPTSPCLDTGSNPAVPPGVTTDLDGRKRIRDADGNSVATVDMGAYEYVDPTAVAPEAGGETMHVEGAGGEISVRYRLSSDAIVTLAVYSVSGRCIRTLEHGARAAGDHVVAWDRRDASGARVARGVYLVVLRDGFAPRTRRLVLAR